MLTNHVTNDLKGLSREELLRFVTANAKHLLEEEAIAILANPYCAGPVCLILAQNQRLTGIYSVRLRLAAHRSTPQAHAVKLVHYLHWPDLVHLSVDVKVPAAVRRAIDTQLLIRVEKMALGERISAARRCSTALIKVLLFDPDPKVFEALLINQRLRQDELLFFASSRRAGSEQLSLLGADRKWSYRYPIRKALVLNPSTPRAVAASQLRYLSPRDLRGLLLREELSTYLRTCIERMLEKRESVKCEV